MVWGSMSIKRGLNQGAGYTTRQSLKLVRGSMASSARAASFMALLVALVSVVIMSGSVCHGARDISGQAGVFDPDRPGACGRGVCPGTPGQPYTRPGGGPYYNKPGRGPYVGPSPPNNGGISGQAATLSPGPLDPNRPVPNTPWRLLHAAAWQPLLQTGSWRGLRQTRYPEKRRDGITLMLPSSSTICCC